MAFAVDINGVALARCNLAATEEGAAEQEARQHLEDHQVMLACGPARSVDGSRQRCGDIAPQDPTLCPLRLQPDLDQPANFDICHFVLADNPSVSRRCCTEPWPRFRKLNKASSDAALTSPTVLRSPNSSAFRILVEKRTCSSGVSSGSSGVGYRKACFISPFFPIAYRRRAHSRPHRLGSALTVVEHAGYP